MLQCLVPARLDLSFKPLSHVVGRVPSVFAATNSLAKQRHAHVCEELLRIGLEHVARLLVEWVVRGGLAEDELQPGNERIEVQRRHVVLAEDVEAHVTIPVDVGVIELGENRT